MAAARAGLSSGRVALPGPGRPGVSTFLPTAEVATVPAKPYSNPANRPPYGSGQVETVWANAQQNGRVFDPNTGDLLTWDRTASRAGQWDMGHLPGREYRVLHRRYMDDELTKDEFLKEYRDPLNYRPESPGSNRSRRHEQK